jgi:transposase, IS5 family
MYLFCDSQLKTDKEIIFENTELGRLRKVLPLAKLSELLPEKKNRSGAPSWVTSEGMIAMLFLQSYTKLSDRKFIDHFNGNWQMQMFCGVQLSIYEPIKDRNMMWRVRSFVSKHLNLNEFQQILIQHWKPRMTDTHVGLSDATVYESYMRYPTDVKLLWECCEYVQSQIEKLCITLEVKVHRKKYEKKKQQYLGYARRRKKPHRLTQKMRKQLLNYCEKLQKQLQEKLNRYAHALNHIELLPVFEKLKVIKQIITQQNYLIKHKGSKLSDRILSLSKPYVRAIVRGKENKAVEFGAKVHMMQIDGINYIEHLSYRAFNETTRFKVSILKHKQLFGTCSHWSADAIYATNKNRKYATSLHIITNFVRKGHPKDDPQEKQIKSLLNKERSTRLEGSFGTEKNFYGLRKVKMKKKETEMLFIYFSVMTANAVRISHREDPVVQRQAA